MRTFGVEEELLLIDAITLAPSPVAEQLVELQERDNRTGGHEIALEFKQEQVEVISPPQTTLSEQLETIRAGRVWADAAAAQVGARVVALPTSVSANPTHLVQQPRFNQISRHSGLTSIEQLTCALHVHVRIESREEGVAVLDRVRGWLPILLALSANSPFWHGLDTGFASFRYQAWNRWPMTGPTDFFGSLAAHDHHAATLLGTGVPLDAGMLYFDARLCDRHSTLEVRVTDVCLEAEQSAVIATMIRALVETAARDWRAGVPAPHTATSVIRAWSWQASRYGVEAQLIDPGTGVPAPAAEVIDHLLETIRPVLTEYGEEAEVTAVVADILAHGSGAHRQRAVYETRRDVRDVVSFALEATHHSRAAKPVHHRGKCQNEESSGKAELSAAAGWLTPARSAGWAEPVV